MTAGRRDQLASALLSALHAGNPLYYEDAADELADALLPVVDRMIRQAQAEALESAAEDLERPRKGWRLALDYASKANLERSMYANYLRDRAAVLRVTTDNPDVTQDAP